jgi:hypothetical protein
MDIPNGGVNLEYADHHARHSEPSVGWIGLPGINIGRPAPAPLDDVIERIIQFSGL